MAIAKACAERPVFKCLYRLETLAAGDIAEYESPSRDLNSNDIFLGKLAVDCSPNVPMVFVLKLDGEKDIRTVVVADGTNES